MARRKLFADEKDNEDGEEENFWNRIREENQQKGEEVRNK